MAHAVKFIRQITLALTFFSLPMTAANLTLKPATIKSWNSYLQQAEARVENAPAVRVSAERSVTVRVEPAVGNGTVPVPDGLIHDWIGTTFIPNATVAQLQAVVHDYDHYKDIYAPTVIDSKAMDVGNGRETFSMEWFRKVLSITTGLDADYANTQTARADGGYVITRSTRIQEIRNFGRENEQKLPADTGSGYIWRICSILRYEQADGGVYLRLEAIVLSRDIPHAVRWVASPIVNHLSRNSVTATLTQTRGAVQTRSGKLTGDALAQAR
jgi:hypothetical protein